MLHFYILLKVFFIFFYFSCVAAYSRSPSPARRDVRSVWSMFSKVCLSIFAFPVKYWLKIETQTDFLFERIMLILFFLARGSLQMFDFLCDHLSIKFLDLCHSCDFHEWTSILNDCVFLLYHLPLMSSRLMICSFHFSARGQSGCWLF